LKRIRADDEATVFELGARERAALVQLLRTYPVVPPAHHTVSQELKDVRVPEYQRLLDEALAEQRAANKQRVETWLAAPGTFEKVKGGYRFTLRRADVEWLLQVLNDIRVGNWLRLGSPEVEAIDPGALGGNEVSAWLAMQMCGYFQMSLLAT